MLSRGGFEQYITTEDDTKPGYNNPWTISWTISSVQVNQIAKFYLNISRKANFVAKTVDIRQKFTNWSIKEA